MEYMGRKENISFSVNVSSIMMFSVGDMRSLEKINIVYIS